MAVGKPYVISRYAESGNYVFRGNSRQECENWISKQNWFDTWQHGMSLKAFNLNAAQGSSLGIVNFARKLLEEIHKQSYYADTYGEPEVIEVKDIFGIIKDLGVPIE